MACLPFVAVITLLVTKLEYSAPILGVSDPFDFTEASSRFFNTLLVLNVKPSTEPMTFSTSLLREAKNFPFS